MSKYSLHVAQAFVSALAEHKDKLGAAAAELTIVAEALATPDAKGFLDHPRVSLADKESVIVATLEKRVGSETLALVRLLVRGNAHHELAAIAASVQTLANRRLGRATATIETADKLDAKAVAELAAALGTLTGKTISVETKANPALLAGVKIFVDGDVVDLSLAGRLAKLRESVA